MLTKTLRVAHQLAEEVAGLTPLLVVVAVADLHKLLSSQMVGIQMKKRKKKR